MSLGNAADKLNRLMRISSDISFSASDLDFAIGLFTTFKSHLTDQLLRQAQNQRAVQILELHSLPQVAFLGSLLENLHAALIDSEAKWHSRANEADILAACIGEAARLLAMFCWISSAEPLPIVWKALTSVYRQMDWGCGKPAEADTPLAALTSVLLLSLSDPFSMHPMEVMAADRLITEHITDVSIDNCWSQGLAPIDLASGRPLATFESIQSVPNQCVVWISISRIAASVQYPLHQTDSTLPPRFQSSTVDMFRTLALRWLSFPLSRRHKRTGAFNSAQVVFGTVALIQIKRSHRGANYDFQRQRQTRDCTLLDYSEKGCRIRLRGPSYHKPSVGTLVYIEYPDNHQRSVGVFSWLRQPDEAIIEAGIRFLARDVELIPLKLSDRMWKSGNLVEFGLLFTGKRHYGELDLEIIMPLCKFPEGNFETLKDVSSNSDYYVRETLEVGWDFIRLGVERVNRT